MYYNTTNESGNQLQAFTDKAGAQDKLVLALFKQHGTLSPSKVYEFLIKAKQITPATPITSIRRSITNLTRDGYLLKTEDKVKGTYGRSEKVWKLNTK